MSGFLIAAGVAVVLVASAKLYLVWKKRRNRTAVEYARVLWAKLQAYGTTSAHERDKEQFAVVLDLRQLGKPILSFIVEQWTRNPNGFFVDWAWSVLWGIASPRTPELIPLLREKLHDPNSRFRYQAIRILEQIGRKAAAVVPRLRELMDADEDMNVQTAAIQALKTITGTRA